MLSCQFIIQGYCLTVGCSCVITVLLTVSALCPQVVELVPSGARIPVTDKTKLSYLDALAQYKLSTSIRSELNAFLKGLNNLIPDNLLSMFDENELELLMCGTGCYSIAELKQHHVVCGSTTSTFGKVTDLLSLFCLFYFE